MGGITGRELTLRALVLLALALWIFGGKASTRRPWRWS